MGPANGLGARKASHHWARGALKCFVGLWVFFGFFSLSVVHCETIPPAPLRHFNDYAGIVSRETAASLDRELAQFERDTSNQLVVAIFRKMESESSVEDYTVRVAESWKVGQAGRNNGAVLFIFVDDRQVYIQVGYGLEPVLTDATASEIIRNEITPRFRTGDFTGGVRAGAQAMMAATRGEYRGTGRTQAEARGPVGNRARSKSPGAPVIFFIIVMIVAGMLSRRSRGNVGYGRRRRWSNSDDWPPRSGGMFGGFGGFGSGGGSSSSGGGGFSGGGGSFGGGGAGGRW